MSTNQATASTSYDNLIAGLQKSLVTEVATIKAGEAFSRGTLLARITSTQVWQQTEYTNASSCDKFGIASEAIDTTAGATTLTCLFVEGEFDANGVILPYSDTLAEWTALLDIKNIYLRNAVSVTG